MSVASCISVEEIKEIGDEMPDLAIVDMARQVVCYNGHLYTCADVEYTRHTTRRWKLTRSGRVRLSRKTRRVPTRMTFYRADGECADPDDGDYDPEEDDSRLVLETYRYNGSWTSDLLIGPAGFEEDCGYEFGNVSQNQ